MSLGFLVGPNLCVRVGYLHRYKRTVEREKQIYSCFPKWLNVSFLRASLT